MSPPRPARPPVAIGATLAKLTDMLDDVGGTVDRDRRRAAACLSELVRSTEDDLPRFAERHLAGREVDAGALEDARELAVELARLVGMIGEAPGAAAAVRELRESMSRRREALERGEAPAAVPVKRSSSAPPPTMPAPPVATSLPTFMQSPPAAGFASFTAPSPPAVLPPAVVPPAVVPPAVVPPAVVPPAVVPPAAAPLPFAPPPGPAPGAADSASRPGAPATGLPFTRDPQRRG